MIIDVASEDTFQVGRILADLSHLPFNSHFRAMLARLVLAGKLENLNNHRGYRKIKDLS